MVTFKFIENNTLKINIFNFVTKYNINLKYKIFLVIVSASFMKKNK